VIFYAIYKNQQTHFTILVALLQGGPRKERFLCNVVPGSGGRRGVAKFRRGSPGFGRGRAVEGSMGHGRLVSLVGRGRGGSGGGAHRQPAAASAADRSAARVVLAGAGRGVAGKERWSYARKRVDRPLYAGVRAPDSSGRTAGHRGVSTVVRRSQGSYCRGTCRPARSA
jgi:hypothetical protein